MPYVLFIYEYYCHIEAFGCKADRVSAYDKFSCMQSVANWQTGNIDRNVMRYEKRPEQTKRNGWRDSART